mgnify:CR=1 FL=1
MSGLFGFKIQPFKGKASFNAKNIGFNDLLTAGTMFAGAGGIGNIAKWSTGNLAKNLTGQNLMKGLTLGAGMVGGGGGSAGGTQKPASGDYNAQIQQLLAHMDQLGHDQLDFAQANEPNRQRAVTSAAHALQPSSVMDSIMRSRNQALGGAYDQAARGNAAMSSQGMASQPGILLDALNQAQSSGNQNMYNQLSPQAQAARSQQLAQIYGTGSTAPDLSSILQSLMSGQSLSNQNSQLNASLKANRPASFLETFLSSAGPLIGQYMNAQQNKPKSVLKTDKYGFTY